MANSHNNDKRSGQTGNSDLRQPPLAVDDGSSILPFAALLEDHYPEALGAIKFPTAKLLENDKGGAAKEIIGVSSDDGGGLVSLDGDTILWNANGQYDYLPEGEVAQDQFEYTLQVGNGVTSTAEVTVYVVGENDPASITGQVWGAVIEDEGTGTVMGRVEVNDIDQGESAFQAMADVEGIYGIFSFSHEIGEWLYSLNNDDPGLEELDEGEVAYDTLTVTSLDGTASEEINVAVQGADEETPLGFMHKMLLTELEHSSSETNLIYHVSDEVEITASSWVSIDAADNSITLDF